jgi:hypothetical protein
MEPEGSSLDSQEPSTWPYPELDQSRPSHFMKMCIVISKPKEHTDHIKYRARFSLPIDDNELQIIVKMPSTILLLEDPF